MVSFRLAPVHQSLQRRRCGVEFCCSRAIGLLPTDGQLAAARREPSSPMNSKTSSPMNSKTSSPMNSKSRCRCVPQPEDQHRVTNTRRGLDVLRARWQGWDVALAVDINAEGHGLPVAAEQYRVTNTRRGLDVLRAKW